MKQIVNGVEVDLTPEEMIEYNQRQADWESGATQRMMGLFTKELEKAINDTAAERQYSSGISCASYVDSTNPQWAEEAQTFIVWRDSVFAYGYHYLEQVQRGEITNPSIESFISGIPGMVWPEPQN